MIELSARLGLASALVFKVKYNMYCKLAGTLIFFMYCTSNTYVVEFKPDQGTRLANAALDRKSVV